jgi:hypothetical protein
MMKKTIKLTESQLVDLVKNVIAEQSETNYQGKVIPCKIHQTISDCMKQKKVSGRLLCSPSELQEANTMFYVVKPGDTFDGILNKKLELNSREGYKSNTYKQDSQYILKTNPKLGGNPENLRAGDILCLVIKSLD